MEKTTLSDKIALLLTRKFGTMTMMWIFLIYGLLGAVWVVKQPVLLYFSNWVQLWSLPLIMVGTNLLGRAAEKRAENDHLLLTESHSELLILLNEIKENIENNNVIKNKIEDIYSANEVMLQALERIIKK